MATATATKSKKFYRVRQLAGRHAEGGKPPRWEDGRRVPGKPDRMWGRGDVFVSATNLPELHNRRGLPPKFEFVGMATEAEYLAQFEEEPEPEEEISPVPLKDALANQAADGLDALNNDDLVALAQLHEVDLTGCTRKAQYIQALRARGIRPD